MRTPRYAVLLFLFLLAPAASFSQRNDFHPEIIGQTPSPLVTLTNQPITITLDNLIVQDRDPFPVYPEGFTLDISSGRNYRVDKNTITPNNNYEGMLTVRVRVNDGKRDSKRFDLKIEVQGSDNAAPEIVGQAELTIRSGEDFELQLTHLNVVDPDNRYPEDFTLDVFDGRNYKRNGNLITPRANFNGQLKVPVSVNDGQNDSKRFDLKIDVLAGGNVAPTITGPESLTIEEDNSFTLKLSDLLVTDPDNVYPKDFALSVQPGTNYVVSGTTITPAANFSGTLPIVIAVNDGQADSPPYSLNFIVNPVNDAPAITGQLTVNTPQNTPVFLSLKDLTVTDPDNTFPNNFILKVRPGSNYTVTGNTVSPAPDFTGVLTVDVTVNDGIADSQPYPLKIGVIRAIQNSPPVITGQKPISIVKNSSLLILLSHLNVEDSDDVYPIGFTLSVLPGENYSVSGTTITPLPKFTGNMLSVRVKVDDGTDESPPYSLKIQIVQASSTPIIVGQKALSTAEDHSLKVNLTDLEVTDTDNPDYPKGFSLRILPGKKEIYTVSGNTVTPALNLNGFIDVQVTVSDGTNTSAEYTLSILVIPVNDAPEISGLETTAMVYEPGGDPAYLFENLELKDVDSDHLSLAEIGFRPANYSPQNDELLFTTDSTTIKGIYDPAGILFLVGYATIDDYLSVIRSIQYNYRMTYDENGNPMEVLSGVRTMYINVHDGQLVSETHERRITMETNISLHIPNAFTPNGDSTNDTWHIESANIEQLENAIIRVYNKRGFLLYESIGFQSEWDGFFNGQTLPAETYYYTIDLHLSYSKQTYKGCVTILH